MYNLLVAMKDLVTSFLAWVFCTIFYKKTYSIGPKPSSPVFIYANHNNMYWDGIIIIKALQKRTANVVASGVPKTSVMGMLLSFINNIPIVRPQDVATQGNGRVIRIQDGVKVHGVDSYFSRYRAGNYLIFWGQSIKIKEVLSDTQLILEQQTEVKIHKPIKYQILHQRLSYHDMFNRVWAAYQKGEYVSIFPEGVSHDQASQLPFKAGIAIILLHYSKENKGKKMPILPIGHNYHNQHIFRSTQVTQLGEKFELPDQIIQLYETDKEKAIRATVMILEDKLREITTQTTQFDDLSIIIMARQLYDNGCRRQLCMEEKLEQNRMISKIFGRFSNGNQEFDGLIEQLTKFKEKRDELKIKITESTPSNFMGSFLLLLISILKMSGALLLALPGLIVATFFFSHIQSKISAKLKVYTQRYHHKNRAYDTVAYETLIYLIIYSSIFLTLCQAALTIYYIFFAQQFAFPHFAIITLALPVLYTGYMLLFVKVYDLLREEARRIHFLCLCIFQREQLGGFMNEKERLSGKMVNFIGKYGKSEIKFNKDSKKCK